MGTGLVGGFLRLHSMLHLVARGAQIGIHLASHECQGTPWHPPWLGGWRKWRHQEPPP
jgi:hypothetical protein